MSEARTLLAKIRKPALRRAVAAATARAEARAEALYLVGGCVRDLLGGAPLEDVDLVVEGDAAELGREMARRVGGRLASESPFGTCRIETTAGVRIDLAMSRREIYRSPASLPEVRPAPIVEDLLRRDFTINSMAIALCGPLKGRLLDPAGGRRDLERGLLRLHHPGSLADDPTRAFRGARFAARLGLRPAKGWTEALRAARRAGSFRRLGAARLRREVERIASEPEPAAALARCGRWALLAAIHPRLRAGAALARALRRARKGAAGRRAAPPGEALVALLAWSLSPVSRPALCARLGFEGRAMDRILGAARAADQAASWTRRAARAPRAARAEGAERISALDPLALAVSAAACGPRVAAALARERRLWERSAPRLSGDRVIALGVPRGEEVSRTLRSLHFARFAGKLSSLAEEIAFVRNRAAGAPP